MTWDRAGGILDDAHVVDGRWGIAPGALRTGSVGYDRMAAFGDQSWTDYEVEGDVTVHGLDHSGYRSPSDGPGGRYPPPVGWPRHRRRAAAGEGDALRRTGLLPVDGERCVGEREHPDDRW